MKPGFANTVKAVALAAAATANRVSWFLLMSGCSVKTIKVIASCYIIRVLGVSLYTLTIGARSTPGLGDGEGDRLKLPDGDTLRLNDGDGDSLADGDPVLLGLGESEADSDSDSLNDGLADTDTDALDDGELDGDGLKLRLELKDGLRDSLADGLGDIETDGLLDSEAD